MLHMKGKIVNTLPALTRSSFSVPDELHSFSIALSLSLSPPSHTVYSIVFSQLTLLMLTNKYATKPRIGNSISLSLSQARTHTQTHTTDHFAIKLLYNLWMPMFI